MLAKRNLPFVSVIIPCYNDESGIRDTLDSLSGQDYPQGNWEVIVVDNNSTDNTVQVAQSFETVIPLLRVEQEKRQGSYAARNKGISVSQGEIMAFIDSDMIVANRWISRGVAAIIKGHDYVGCRVDIYSTQRPPNVWEIHNIRTGFQFRTYMEKSGHAGAGNLFVRRAVFDSVGLFDGRLMSSGDIEFGNRVRDAGFKHYYDHDNPMRHTARSSLRSYWSKYVRIGKAHIDLRFFYPERYGVLELRHVISQFFPVVHLWLDVSDLGMRRKLGMWFVANIQQFVYAYGQLIRYIHRRVRPKL